MPEQLNKDFAHDEANENEKVNQPTRRRGSHGRRVVRGAGAADANVTMKVEESAKAKRAAETEPAAMPPALPAAQEHAALPAGSSEEQPVHRRRRRSALQDAEDVTHRRRGSRSASRVSHEESDTEESAQQPVRRRRRRMTHVEEDPFLEPVTRRHSRAERNDRNDDDHEESMPAQPARPMTSLLFQEPVLPSVLPEPEPHESRDHGDANETGDEELQNPRRRRRNRHHKGEESAQQESESSQETSEEQPRRHKNRRLNAEERAAAAEVEQIEEDLLLDDIVYSPIDDETKSEEQPTRTRRRRRRKSADSAAQETESSDNEQHAEDHESSDHHDDDAEETTTVRRRRRRRKNSAEEEAPAASAHRSRKQQYIDEITDVEGSTRLEAKKQRRRDNRRERSRQNQLLEQDFLARRENVNRLMVVRERGQHTQISVIEDNVLVEHYVSDIQEVATVGNIYLGRVQNVLPSMEAAFVDIGQARNGVLYAGEVNWDATRLDGQPRRIELAFKSGDPVLVQVTKDPIGHKGARLTSQVTLAGRFLVLVPSGGMTGVSRKLSDHERSRLKNIVAKIAPKDMGVIIRTAADGASQEAITKDLESLIHQWEQIQAKKEEFLHGKRPKLLQGEPDVAIRVVRDIFNDDFSKLVVEGDGVYQRICEYLDAMAPDLKDKLEKWDPAEHAGKDVFDKWQIDSQLRKGMERQVYLPSGGSIVIDRTEAMTTVDVNTGRFIGKGRSLEETVTRCNLEAAEEIARQLRLRDIGGMVMIDFVDMVMPANRDLVLRRLVECLARDRTKHQVAEVTSLGLVQMTRKRIGQGLVEAFSEECPTCHGRGFIVHDEPTVSADYADPYAMKGGDPFVKTNKHGHGTETRPAAKSSNGSSSSDVKAKLAQIAAAAVAANEESAEASEAAGAARAAESEPAKHEEHAGTAKAAAPAAPTRRRRSVKPAGSAKVSEPAKVTETHEGAEGAAPAEPQPEAVEAVPAEPAPVEGAEDAKAAETVEAAPVEGTAAAEPTSVDSAESAPAEAADAAEAAPVEPTDSTEATESAPTEPDASTELEKQGSEAVESEPDQASKESSEAGETAASAE